MPSPKAPCAPIQVTVKVKPRASRTQVLGFKAGQLQVSVAAAPVDGAANDAVCRCLAEALSLGVRSVRIVRGEHARTKQVEISGVAPERWAQLATEWGLP